MRDQFVMHSDYELHISTQCHHRTFHHVGRRTLNGMVQRCAVTRPPFAFFSMPLSRHSSYTTILCLNAVSSTTILNILPNKLMVLSYPRIGREVTFANPSCFFFRPIQVVLGPCDELKF